MKDALDLVMTIVAIIAGLVFVWLILSVLIGGMYNVGFLNEFCEEEGMKRGEGFCYKILDNKLIEKKEYECIQIVDNFFRATQYEDCYFTYETIRRQP